MSPTKTSVAIVIVNWGRPHDTLECLDSISNSETPDFPIVVVDNGSQDKSVEIIKSYTPEVDLITLPYNTGFATGYNRGIEHALRYDSSHIFILNNDTILEPSAIRILSSSNWDIAVPKILVHSSPDVIWSAGARWRSFPPSVIINGLGRKDGIQFNSPKRLEYATGCALMIRSSVIERIGGFDTDYVNYFEDYDFCYRAIKSGFTIGYVPTACVYHKVSKSFGERSSRKWWYIGRNSVLFYLKDKRFHQWMHRCFVIWSLIGFALKGDFGISKSFIEGVRVGHELIKDH
jgi:hypothetical protein